MMTPFDPYGTHLVLNQNTGAAAYHRSNLLILQTFSTLGLLAFSDLPRHLPDLNYY
jgi:hypothetical protein